jgi:uncharacterized delta-60 repeat protein
MISKVQPSNLRLTMTSNLLTIIFLVFCIHLSAQTGPLDQSFGNNGSVITGFNIGDSYGNVSAIQPDGKILLAGYAYQGGVYRMSLSRFHADGTLDGDFGSNGTAFADFPNNYSARPNSLLLQPDGRIIAVCEITGYAYGSKFAMTRFNPTGSLDTGFGADGYVLTSTSKDLNDAKAAFLQTDGKIELFGISDDNPELGLLSVIRYNNNGTLDSTFAGTGIISTDTFGIAGNFSAVQLPDHKILCSGKSGTHIGVIRLNPDGTPDQSFGNAGLAQTPLIEDGGYTNKTMAAGPDGKIVVCGNANGPIPNQTLYALSRLNPNGTLDSSFAVNGLLKLSSDFFNLSVRSVAVQSDGKILMTGVEFLPGANSPFLIERLKLDGTLDSTFGTNGFVAIDNFVNPANYSSLITQTDGKIILTGTSRDTWNYRESIYRFNTDGSIDLGLNGTGNQFISLGKSTDFATALAIGPNDEIVAGGFSNSQTQDNIALTRHLPDGSPDLTLGTNGTRSVHFFGLTSGNYIVSDYKSIAMAVQPDGKTVFAGNADRGQRVLVLSRVNVDGSLDSTFANNGLFYDTLAYYDTYAVAVAVLPNGKIAVGGGLEDASGTTNSFVSLFLPNGTPDSSFNGNGTLEYNFGGTYGNAVMALQIQSDGKILAGGRMKIGDIRRYTLARINPNGTLDGTFGTAGKVITLFPNSLSAGIQTLQVQPDGKIIAGGAGNLVGPTSYLPPVITLARYNPNGTLDGSFGTAGKQVTNYGTGIETTSLALESDGKIVVAGALWTGSNGFTLLRYKSNGTLDSIVGTNGILTISFGGTDEKSFAVAVQPDGKIVLGGYTNPNNDQDFAIIRFIGGSGLVLGAVDFSKAPEQTLIYPNPIQQSSTLEYTLPESTTVSLELYDLQGRFIHTYFNHASRESGNIQEKVDIPAGLPDGPYVLVLSTPQGQISVKIMKKA